MNRKSKTAVFSVGFVLFVATIIVIFALFSVGRGQGFFSDGVRYYAYLPSASGIAPGARVYLSGVAVGTVERIGFSGDLDINKVRLTLRIDGGAVARIREDSRLWLQTEGLLGDYSVRVSMGRATSPQLEPGSEIPVEDVTLLDTVAGKQISSNTAALMESMLRILEQIQRGEGTLGQLVRNPKLYDELETFLATLNTLGTRLEGVTKEVESAVAAFRSEESFVGKVLFTREYDEKLSRFLENAGAVASDLQAIASDVKEGRGTLGRVVADPSLYDRGVEAVTQVASVASDIGRVLETAERNGSVLGRVLADPELGSALARLVTRLERGAESVETILASIERGEGSVGMLVQDPSIATGLRNVVLGVQELGYVRNLVSNAESIGMEVSRRRRFSAPRSEDAERVGEAVRATADPTESATVPATSSERGE